MYNVEKAKKYTLEQKDWIDHNFIYYWLPGNSDYNINNVI